MEDEQVKNDVGLKLSQPFFDAESASDKDLIASSSFPLLKEEATGVFNINELPHSGGLFPVHNHQLDYYPFFVVLDDQGKMRLDIEWQVDTGNLYFLDSASLFPPVGGTGNFRWTIYRLNVFSPFKSTNTETVTTASARAYDPNYGFKFAKEGASIDSDDLRDFTLHSRGRSPLIHSVDVREWPSGAGAESHTVRPDFTYNPIAFGFVLNRPNPRAYNMQNGGQATPKLSRSNGTIEITSTGNSTSRSSIIVFKDPFLAPETIQVTY